MDQAYTEQWPDLAPKWCDDEIKKAKDRLADKGAAPSAQETKKLEERIGILERVKSDFKAMGYA